MKMNRFTAVVALIWELTQGRIHAAHDSTFGVLGSLHSVFMPIVYSIWNAKIRRSIRVSACCVRLRGPARNSGAEPTGKNDGSRYSVDNIPSQGSALNLRSIASNRAGSMPGVVMSQSRDTNR
jgi:hypothetical protein